MILLRVETESDRSFLLSFCTSFPLFEVHLFRPQTISKRLPPQAPHLYPHPAAPVVDMNIRSQGQMPIVQFSADPTRSYLIQSSTDLVHWTTIGAPLPEAGTGDYDFTDTNAGQSTCSFYRIVTN